MAAGDTTRLIIDLEVLLRNLNKSLRGLDQIKRKLDSVASIKFNARTSTASVDRQALAAQRLVNAQQRVAQSSQRLAIAQKRIEIANLRTATSFERAKLGAERFRREQERIASTSRRSSGFVAGIAGGLTAIIGTAALSAIHRGASAWFEYSSKLEATRIAFTTMLGSAQAADAHLRELQQFALATPFQFSELVDASQRMQALGFEAKQVVPILTDVGNAVAAAGGGGERLDRVVLALSQMQNKGKVATQEMNQLAEAGIPAWKILEEQLGKSRSELIKLVEAGKISSKVFLDAFQQFSRANFGGLMEKQSKTAIGALSNIQDAVLQLSDKAFEPLFKLVSSGLNSIAKDLQTNQTAWEAWGRSVSNSIASTVTGVGLVIKELRSLDREIGEQLRLPELQEAIKQAADRQEQSKDNQLVIAVALLNSLRGQAARKPERFDDEGEFAIAGNIPAAIKTKDKIELPTDKAGGGRAALNRLRDLAKQLSGTIDRLLTIRADSALARVRAGIEQQFSLTRDGLNRELSLLQDHFEDRAVPVKKFFEERRRLQEAEIDSELEREKGLSSALGVEFGNRRAEIEREFATAQEDIRSDPDLKGRARIVALQVAEQKKQNDLAQAFNGFETESAEISTRILILQRQRKDVAVDTTRQERILTEEIAKQKDELRFSLLEEQGRTADAEGGRLKARFTEILRDLRIDTSDLGAELQEALANVDLSVLQQRLDQLPEPVRVLIDLLDIGLKRAQIAEAQQLVDDLSAGLRLDEQKIQSRVLDGLISQREAQAAMLALQQEYRAVLLDVLRGELAKAEAIKDQTVIVALQTQIAETERLGIAVDEVGQQINQQLFSDLQSGISGIFSGARKGFEGLRDAAISFGERLLDSLNDIAATSIVKQLEGLFKPDATNTQGTVGGFLSKIFGLAPQKAAEAGGAAAAGTALTTGATAAATALTTSGTAAGAAMATGGTAGGTAIAAGATTGSAALVTSISAAAAAFSAAIIAAGAAFAATVAAASASQAIGGVGSDIAGALGGAATGLFPAVPGGVYKFIEGGHPEAVLTTDPKYAASQVEILRRFLRHTRGLGGRIKAMAAGGIITPSDISLNVPSVSIGSSSIGELAVAGTPSTMRLRQVLVDQRDWRNEINSPEGEQVLVDFLYKKQHVIRKLSGK